MLEYELIILWGELADLVVEAGPINDDPADERFELCRIDCLHRRTVLLLIVAVIVSTVVVIIFIFVFIFVFFPLHKMQIHQ